MQLTRVLQLVWFAQVFLHAENPCAAISLGRIDQYLWPFLDEDLRSGRSSLDQARELVGAFFLKCCEGEESQNAVVGGVDAAGHDASNPLSVLCLEVMRELRTFQPSLCVRWHEGAPEEFRTAALELAAAGTGQPGFLNDPVVIRGLLAAGIPESRAWDWAVVGCYEASPQGDCYPNTVLGRLNLARVMRDYLDGVSARTAGNFDAFLAGWLERVRVAYQAHVLTACQQQWNWMKDHAPSPFGSVLMEGCVEQAQPLEAGAARFNLVGINIVGLGSVVDSLHAVRTMVYEKGAIGLDRLIEAARTDFSDDVLRAQLQGVPGRYGTDHAETNALAHTVSVAVNRMVLDSRMEGGVRPYPAWFAFAADIYDTDMATPDGRRRGEWISYGVGPSAGVATTPTAMMASASHVEQDAAACGCPLAVTLAPRDVRGDAGMARMEHLLRTYFSMGGFHVHFNLAGAEELRQAQAHPELHGGLTVRVSGYSARFARVERRWQDALIERAERGV